MRIGNTRAARILHFSAKRAIWILRLYRRKLRDKQQNGIGRTTAQSQLDLRTAHNRVASMWKPSKRIEIAAIQD